MHTFPQRLEENRLFAPVTNEPLRPSVARPRARAYALGAAHLFCRDGHWLLAGKTAAPRPILQAFRYQEQAVGDAPESSGGVFL